MSVSLSLLAGAGWQFFDDNGTPLSGGLIHTYQAGTTTPAATYTSSTGGTANSNPIVLDAAGRPSAEIWLDDQYIYKFTVSTSAGVLIRTYDNIPGAASAQDIQDILAMLAASSGSSLIGFIQAGTGAVAQTLQTKNRKILNTADFDTIDNYDTAREALSGNYNDMLVQSDIDNTESLLGSELTHLRTQKPAWYSFPRLMRTISSYDTAVNPAINIVGFGSSVGAGATLPDPATQAPVAVFSSTLESVIDPGGIYNFVTYNDSVNGSTFSEAAAALDAAVAGGHTPDICVLVYGMNDGAPAIFNSGQTYPAVYSSIMQFVTKARGYGSDVVLMTTPHPNTDLYTYYMPDGIPQTYPTAVAAPVGPEQLVPSASTSNITADWLGTGQNITAAHRHYRVNQAMRQAATDAGIPLIDAERYWFKAVAKFGVAALYDTGETVHPNLLGHQNSYWLAIDEFLQAVGWQTGQEGQEPRLNGLVGVNNDSPEAVLDVVPPYPNGTTTPFQVRARVGATGGDGVKAATVVWKVDPSNGDLVGYAAKTTDSSLIEVYRHHYALDVTGTAVQTIDTFETYAGTSSRVRYGAVFNVSGAQDLLLLPDNSAGTAYVNGSQSGIGRKRARVEWVSNSGVVTFGTIENVGSAVFTGPTASGLTLQVTAAAANTNLQWQIVVNTGF